MFSTYTVVAWFLFLPWIFAVGFLLLWISKVMGYRRVAKERDRHNDSAHSLCNQNADLYAVISYASRGLTYAPKVEKNKAYLDSLEVPEALHKYIDGIKTERDKAWVEARESSAGHNEAVRQLKAARWNVDRLAESLVQLKEQLRQLTQKPAKKPPVKKVKKPVAKAKRVA